MTAAVVIYSHKEKDSILDLNFRLLSLRAFVAAEILEMSF